MKKKLKGGIETIIAIVILVGLVIALICAAVIPTMEAGEDLAGTAVNKLNTLGTTISPEGG